MKKSYSAAGKLLKQYWEAYGRGVALLKSPFFHLALTISILSYKNWLYEEWWQLPIEILPNLIGFTLGGFAILLAFSDTRFTELIRGAEEKNTTSLYMQVNSAFVHFLLIQIIALLVAIIFASNSINNHLLLTLLSKNVNHAQSITEFVGNLANFLGYTIFLYSLTASLAAILSIFNVARLYDKTPLNEENVCKYTGSENKLNEEPSQKVDS